MKAHKLLYGTLLISIMLQPLTTFAYTKKETIYTNLDETGKIYKQAINNHLYLSKEDDVIEDETYLKDILNINGKEKFKLQDQKLTWENKGKDIFYQGVIDKDNPLETKVTYYLDEKEMKVDKMLGKKGNVKIHIEFVNRSLEDEKEEYIPLVVTLGTMFSDTENRLFEITNGKVVDTGTKTVAFAIASPGLYENTKISEFEKLNDIDITYETTNFSLPNIYFVATPKLLEEQDLKVFDQMDGLSSSMYLLQENMDKLETGIKEVEQGMNSVVSGSSEIIENLRKAKEAVEQLKVGSIQVDDGMRTIVNGVTTARNMIQQENVSVEKLTLLKQSNLQALALLQSTNNQLEVSYQTYQLENFETDDSIKVYFTSLGLTETQIKDLITCKKTYESNRNLIELLTQNTKSIDLNITTLSLLEQLSEGVLLEKEGTSRLSNGLSELAVGMNQLYQGMESLNIGSKTLHTGITTLSAGMTTFNQEGIKTLTGYASTAKNYSDKLKNVAIKMKEYNGFASNNVENTVFVYKIRSVK